MAANLGMAAVAPQCGFHAFEGLRAQPAERIGAPCTSSSCPPAGRTLRLSVRADKRVVKKKQIILTTDVKGLGSKGELLTVRPGYFRNFLSPSGQAKTATAAILKAIKDEEDRIIAEKKQAKDEAEEVAKLLQNSGGYTVRRKVGKDKQIFGSVTAQDLVDIIRSQSKKEVDKKSVEVPEIKSTGQYVAEVRLHPDVVALVKINVVAS